MILSKGSKWLFETICFYSDPPAQAPGETTGQSISELAANLPALMQAYNGQVGATTAAQENASSAVSPQYEQLMSDLYKQFAPGLAATGSQIDNQTRTATANTDASLLAGPGANIATTTDAIDRANNPEYYTARAQAGSSLGQLLNSINLNNPNIEAERQINQENQRSGNTAPNSATNTVSNALSFGDQNLKRVSALGSAIGTATNFLQSANNPVATNAATSELSKPPSQSGTSQFAGVTPAATQSYSSGSDLLNSISGFQNNAASIDSNRRDVLDRVNGTLNSL